MPKPKHSTISKSYQRKPHRPKYSQACLVALTVALLSGLMPLASYTSPTQVSALARKTLNNITTMQEMNATICANSALGQSNTLTDVRDGNTYTVARLSDGNCWMTRNLRIANYDITIENAHLSDVTVSEEDQKSESGKVLFHIPDDASGFVALDDEETKYNNNAAYSYDMAETTYYSWYTATAGTGSTSLVSKSETNTSNAPSSICPNGWRLPTGGLNGEFQVLYHKFRDASWVAGVRANENGVKSGRWLGANSEAGGGAFFAVTGFYHDGNIGNEGGGNFWSSTAYTSNDHAYSLYFYSDGVYDTYHYDKYYGRSVRCLAASGSTEFPNRFDEKDVQVIAVKVSPYISIDTATGVNDIVDPNEILAGTITATISANTDYKVYLSSEEPDLKSPDNPDHSIPADTKVEKNNNAWGILNQDGKTYSKLEPNKQQEFYNTRTYQDSDKRWLHAYNVGISVAPSLPAGTYSTSVTITAVNN